MDKALFSRRTCLQTLSAFCALGSAAVRAADKPVSAGKRILVVYFSWAGSSETVAKEVHRILGGDIARIERVEPYPTVYEKTTEVAKAEKSANARPAIKPMPDVRNYDIIVIGHAIWSGTMPMPVRTFLESQDFSGKTVAHWTTHGGSGLGDSQEILERALKSATVLPGLGVYGWGGVLDIASVGRWLKRIGLAK